MDQLPDYTKYTITNIRRGKGKRAKYIYAQVCDENGKVVINGTLDYIVRAFGERLPLNEKTQEEPQVAKWSVK